MTHEMWTTAIQSKVRSSWNLHDQLPENLKFFIFLASVSGIIGSVGQSNYAAGNSYQDALARHRVSIGQKAVSIDLGWMSEIGVVAENEKLRGKKELFANMTSVTEEEYLSVLDFYCNPELPVLLPDKSQIVFGFVSPDRLQDLGLEVPQLLNRKVFAAFSQPTSSTAGTQSAIDGTNDAMLFRQADSAATRAEIVVNGLLRKLARILSKPEGEMDPAKPFSEYGIDSLVAVEIRNWISKEFAVDISVFDLMSSASTTAVGELVALQT
jgi:acyl carrier protein